ncbi:MAG: hypothetical protein ACREBS_02280 [Nitrososphaerales archaeon]
MLVAEVVAIVVLTLILSMLMVASSGAMGKIDSSLTFTLTTPSIITTTTTLSTTITSQITTILTATATTTLTKSFTTTNTTTVYAADPPAPHRVKSNGYFLATPIDIMAWNQSAFSSLVHHLSTANVTYLYFNLPNLDQDASLQDNFSLDTSLIVRFDQTVGINHPRFQFIAWTGTQDDPDAIIADYTSYGINETITSLYKAGFDGLLLDLEPVSNDSPQFLKMLSTFRASIEQDAPGFLLGTNSMTVYPYEPPGHEWGWDTVYFQNVTSLINFVSPMLFESGTSDLAQYVQFVDGQIQYTSQYAKCPVIYAIPDWYANTTYHHPLGENLSNAVIAFRTYITKSYSPSPSKMLGLAIYGLNKTYILQPGTVTEALETTPHDWSFFVGQWVNTIYAQKVGSGIE